MKNILVTGAGALLGQGILRCLNFSDNAHNYNVISADPDVRSTGHALAQKSYCIPFASDPEYLKKVEEIIQKEQIDLLMIGTDPELLLFAAYSEYLKMKYGVQVVVSNEEVIRLANDKWLTAQFLKENNYPYPLSALTTDKEGIQELKIKNKYPLIAKPIDGARSRGIVIIHNAAELDVVCSYENNLVVQEMLSETEGEFTTGCIVVNGKCAAIVTLVRDLRDGNTWRAYRNERVAQYDEIIKTIAEKLGAEGPINFQFRIKNGAPVIFEINGRFSGTTPLRLMYGFNEVEALVRYYLEGKEIEQPILKEGVVLRTFSDLFIENDTLADFVEKGVTDHFDTQYYPFKKV